MAAAQALGGTAAASRAPRRQALAAMRAHAERSKQLVARGQLHTQTISPGSVAPIVPSRASTAAREVASATAASATASPLLAYEIVQGPLVRYSTVGPGRAPPTAVLVHGILGRRQNMMSFARRLVEGFPHWQVVVADLRCHGESAALSHALHGPHTLEAAANDVIRLLSVLKLFPEMLIGHSFGGKVVLQMTKHWSTAARRVPRPVQVWVLDTLPGEVRSGDMGGADRPADLISTLQRVPLPVPNRQWLISHLEGAGFSRQVAAWAATNLAPLPSGGLGWGFDLPGISQMFRSYETADLWPLLAAPADGVTVSFVKAERSTFRWGGTDEARIRALGHAVHELPNSGHWVHSDQPEALFRILAPSFSSSPDIRVSPRNNILASHPAAVAASSAGSRQLTALEM